MSQTGTYEMVRPHKLWAKHFRETFLQEGASERREGAVYKDVKHHNTLPSVSFTSLLFLHLVLTPHLTSRLFLFPVRATPSPPTPTMAVATPLEPASKATPCSILLPCSSLPKPIKTQAGERKLGWLAAPPRELTLPRPIAPVVDDNDIEIEQGPLPESLCPTSVSQDDFDSSTASSTVPSSSPSASQESVETSATSATSASGPEPSDKMPTFSALQRSGSISVADATRPQWDRKDSDGQSTPRSSSTPRSVSSRAGPNTAIRFSTLPERPPELRRRNSITLGVLARKNMLSAQGTYNPTPMGQGASGMSGGSGFSKVYMTDEEWQAYQEKFAKKTGA